MLLKLDHTEFALMFLIHYNGHCIHVQYIHGYKHCILNGTHIHNDYCNVIEMRFSQTNVIGSPQTIMSCASKLDTNI